MAGAVRYTPNFVINIALAQQENAEAFDWAMRKGAEMVFLQMATDAGIRLVAWTYNKVKKRWQPDLETVQPALALPDGILEDVSPPRRGPLMERFAEVQGEMAEQSNEVHDELADDDVKEFKESRRQLTPEEKEWVRMNQGATQQPQPLLAAAAQQASASCTLAAGHPTQLQLATRQIQRVESGQPLLPVDDHGISNNHNEADDQTKIILAYKQKGKAQLGRPTGDSWFDNNNDPWQ